MSRKIMKNIHMELNKEDLYINLRGSNSRNDYNL